MASLRKKDRSPFWFACYTLPDGRRTQRSTGTPDKRKALCLALNTRMPPAKLFLAASSNRGRGELSQTFTRLPTPKCFPIRPPTHFENMA